MPGLALTSVLPALPQGTSARVYAYVTTDTTHPILTACHATTPVSLAAGLANIDAHNVIPQSRLIETSTDPTASVTLDTMITVPPTA